MTLELLQNIYGIGPKLAQQLYKKIPKKSYTKKQLYDFLSKSKIFKNLPIASQHDILYRPTPVPWYVIDEINTIMTKYVRGIKFKICGSYRRHKEICKDIDLVINKGRRENVWRDFINMLRNTPITFMEPYAEGTDKIGCLIAFNDYIIRMDIFITTSASWAYTILYATGSKQFNIVMRAHAKNKNMLLNRTCLNHGGVCLPANTEKQIFYLVGMDYVSPPLRDL